MSDDDELARLRGKYGRRWHIWHNPGFPWSALPLDPPFGDPVRGATADELEARLQPGPTDQGSL